MYLTWWIHTVEHRTYLMQVYGCMSESELNLQLCMTLFSNAKLHSQFNLCRVLSEKTGKE